MEPTITADLIYSLFLKLKGDGLSDADIKKALVNGVMGQHDLLQSSNKDAIFLNKNFSILNNKMKEDNSTNHPGPSTSSFSNAKNFVFLSPSIPPRPLFDTLRSQELKNAPSRPVMTSLGFFNKQSNSNQLLLNKSNQPELKFDELQTKKQSYYFNSDQLFAKPNEILMDHSANDELSSALDEELNNSKMDIDSQEKMSNSSFSRDSQHRSSNHSHKHHHHLHHHHSSSSKHKSKGGKLTISKEQVIKFKKIMSLECVIV